MSPVSLVLHLGIERPIIYPAAPSRVRICTPSSAGKTIRMRKPGRSLETGTAFRRWSSSDRLPSNSTADARRRINEARRTCRAVWHHHQHARNSVPSIEMDTPLGYPTVQPYAFGFTERFAEREYTPGEMTQLPDLSYSLHDWVLGNEFCPIGEIDVRACHAFASHMGTLNSSHFLPQAERFFHHYHDLALERADACREMRELFNGDFEEFIQQCDQQAFTFESIGHHYLQDAWSMGHMWSRWGGPNPHDFGGADWRERALLVALSAGLIHGSKGVLQELVDSFEFLKKVEDPGIITHPDIRDAMCAPINPRDFSCADDAFTCIAPVASRARRRGRPCRR
jgi:hypothetical protein